MVYDKPNLRRNKTIIDDLEYQYFIHKMYYARL